MERTEHVIPGTEGLPITLDIHRPETILGPMVIYAHGFKGFKDWGGMDLVAQKFANAGMPFLKFNFSHNGTTPKSLGAFPNKEAFQSNTISKELNDLFIVFKWVKSKLFKAWETELPIALIGHSKGGTESILYAARNPADVSKLITWSAPSRVDIPWYAWPTEKIFDWHKTGIAGIENKRTGEKMNLGLELLEDFENHKANYDILEAASRLEKMPWLICHGETDEAVDFKHAKKLHKANKKSELFAAPDTGHTYGRKHPWEGEELPEATTVLIEKSLDFLLE